MSIYSSPAAYKAVGLVLFIGNSERGDIMQPVHVQANGTCLLCGISIRRLCLSQEGDSSEWECTRPINHIGPHIGCISPSSAHKDHAVKEWPNRGEPLAYIPL
jgi:hypothetical protein